MEIVDGHRDVEAHSSTAGRYKVRIEPHDGKDHSHDEPTKDSIVLHQLDDDDVEVGADTGAVTT